jgi:carbon storage regulator
MLILTRRPGERVVIGDQVFVTVISVSGHTVRLGIDAPSGVSIYREEIWQAVREENRAAAQAADPGAIPQSPPDAPSPPQAPSAPPPAGAAPDPGAAGAAPAGAREDPGAGAPAKKR